MASNFMTNWHVDGIGGAAIKRFGVRKISMDMSKNGSMNLKVYMKKIALVKKCGVRNVAQVMQ